MKTEGHQACIGDAAMVLWVRFDGDERNGCQFWSERKMEAAVWIERRKEEREKWVRSMREGK
jgi:hypothetical protein